MLPDSTLHHVRTWGLLAAFLGLFALTGITLVRLENTKDTIVRNQQEILRRQAIAITNHNRIIQDLHALCLHESHEAHRDGVRRFESCPYSAGLGLEGGNE